jgi:hypothetical protein
MFSFLRRQEEARLEERIQSKLASRERADIILLGPNAARPLARIAVKYGNAPRPPFRHEFLFDVLLEIVRNCPESDTQAVFRALRYGLRNSRGSYRHQFIKLLGILGLKQGIKLLAREARDDHYCSSALDALGMISNEESVHLLKQYLKHREWSARSAALRGIARIGQPGAESVISAIRDPDLQSDRTWALEYLSRKRAVSEISNIKAQSGPAMVPLLVEHLSSTKDQFLRVAIIQALAEARDPRAVPALVRLDGLLARSYPWSDLASLGVTSLKAALADALVSIADFSQATEGDLIMLTKVPDDIKTERKRFGDNEYECLHKDGHSWEEEVTTVLKAYDDLREMAACELRSRDLGNTLQPRPPGPIPL